MSNTKAPNAAQQPLQTVVGARIRTLREAAGMSQGALARRVFVARQTVNNWETGKTLPDAQSLELLAEAFRITVDSLLRGDNTADAAALIDAAAEVRHELMAALVKAIGCYLLMFVCLLIEMALRDGLGERVPYGSAAYHTLQGVIWLLLVVRLLVTFGLFHYSMRLQRLMKDHDFHDAVELVAFIEGRRPSMPLPDTLLYRVMLPHWDATRFFIGLCLAVTLCLFWAALVVF